MVNANFDSSKKRLIVFTRWLACLVVSYLLISREGLYPFSPLCLSSLIILLYVISNLFLSFRSNAFFHQEGFDIALFCLDITVISLSIYLAGINGTDFYIIFFLEILIISMAQDLKNILIGTAIFCGVYGLILMNAIPENYMYQGDYISRILFLSVIGIFFGISVKIFSQKLKRDKYLSENHQLILDNIQEVVFSLDCRGRFTFISPNCEHILGENAEVLMENPKAFKHCVLHEDEKGINTLLNHAIKKPTAGELAFRINHPVRGIRWLHMVYSPVLDKNEDLMGIQGAIKDISDLKEARNTIIRSEGSCFLGKLFFSMSVEINNPLQVIKNAVHLLEKNKNLSHIQKFSMNMIQEAEGRIENMVQKATECVQFENSEKIPLNINQLLLKAVSLIKNRIKLDRIQINLDLDPENIMVSAIPNLLYDVFLNILLNAIEAMDDGGFLFLSTTHKGNRTEVRFADTGHGIPPEHLDDIFIPFFSTKKSKNASGLGLTISQWIIHDMGGDIRVHSLEGDGTTITLTFPLHRTSQKTKKGKMKGLTEVCHA
ncbi:MAG: two-component system sensor histidine kinase NtrB [bacterium]